MVFSAKKTFENTRRVLRALGSFFFFLKRSFMPVRFWFWVSCALVFKQITSLGMVWGSGCKKRCRRKPAPLSSQQRKARDAYADRKGAILPIKLFVMQMNIVDCSFLSKFISIIASQKNAVKGRSVTVTIRNTAFAKGVFSDENNSEELPSTFWLTFAKFNF